MRTAVCCWLAILICCAGLMPGPLGAEEPADREYDLVVYGGTSGGVIAAVQAKKMGHTVILVCPDTHLGGLSSGGLGFTDTGDKRTIGGLSREFYHRVWKKYNEPEAWRWQKREEYGNKGQGTPAIDGDARTMWIFEPHIAEQVFKDLVKDFKIPVQRNEWLNREPGQGVEKANGRITAITTLSGKTYRGKMFIDATYEGDLLAAAGVSFHVGRESKATYGEDWNGIQTGVLHHGHHFGAVKQKISPYVKPGDPSSGVLPRVSTENPGKYGEGDNKVQAYCFRMCLTNHEPNRLPFPKPEGYDPAEYELLLRVFNAGWRETFSKFDDIPNYKTDTNNHGPFSTDNIGYNYDYPEASYERRREIIAEHVRYQQGLMYFIANDPRVPEDVRSQMAKWGLAKDEFADNGHWPHQIYVREARRMVGKHVMTEHELLKRRPTPESVGMGSYTMDSHNVQRYITPDGYVQNEGDIGVSTHGPYQISYGSLIPKKNECENLLVPVCISSSHIAFGSIRMEPVFMVLGQSAATAAMESLDRGLAVQDLPYDILQKRLLEEGQVLELEVLPTQSSRAIKLEEGVVVDDAQATVTGPWQSSTTNGPFLGVGYRHDNNEGKGERSVSFKAQLKRGGQYEVRLLYPPNTNRATNVPVTIRHADGETVVKVNQRKAPDNGPTASLGKFTFVETGEVIISNAETDGYVIADAVQFVPVK